MNRLPVIVLIATLVLPVVADAEFSPPQRINEGWSFLSDDALLSFEQAQARDDWSPVTLPHTPRVEPRIVNDQWQGDAWYRRSLPWDPAWSGKKVIIDFEAAMNAAEVWLNGTPLARHLGGYLPFSVDLTTHLRPADNLLVVRLDNRDNPITGPKPLEILDFNLYGGLYRNVWLRVENPVHITDPVQAGRTASGGVRVRYPEVGHDRARVEVQTHLANDGQGQPVRVVQTLSLDGTVLGSDERAVELAEGGEGTVLQTLEVTQPRLWSPNRPALYDLDTTVWDGENLLDRQTHRIGIREFRIEDGRLLINGEPTFLRGVNRHQEYPYVGYALSDAAQYRDAEKIKAAGFDYVRLSHYPHSPAFMRAADEIGLVVLDAILGWQYVNDDPAFTSQVLQTCRDLIRRDRNHPSVLAWECSLNESKMPDSMVDALHAIVHEELPGPNTFSAGWLKRGYDIYLQARQHRLGHQQTIDKPYIVSEYGDWEYYAMNAGLNQDAWADLQQAERSSRQRLSDGETRLRQQAANVAEAHDDNFTTPAFADGYWVMFDYNRGYADDLEASGVMSLERLPKFSHFFFRSQRSPDAHGGPIGGGPMVFIASHWMAGSSPVFHVYSNADSVRLRFNDDEPLVGRRDRNTYPNLPYPPFRFDLGAYRPGRLEAIAVIDGAEVARHRVVTPGPPAGLRLDLEATSIPPRAGVNDLVFVYAHLEDADGHSTRINGAAVRFSLEGDAELVSPPTVSTEAGIAAALIRVGDDPAGVRLRAVHGPIESATLALTSEESSP